MDEKNHIINPVGAKYTPIDGEWASHCDPNSHGKGCKSTDKDGGYRCCRAVIGNFEQPWKCYPK